MQKTKTFRAALIAAAACFSMSAHALADSPRQFNIPPGELAAALDALARQSGVELMYSSAQVRGLQTAGLQGEYTAEDAAHRLLAGTKLKLKIHESGALLISDSTAPRGSASETAANRGEVERPSADVEKRSFWSRLRFAQSDTPPSQGEEVKQPAHPRGSVELEEIVVTGSHIRRSDFDAPSPVIVITRQDLDRSGRTTIVEALAQLPQNFASVVSMGFGDGTQAINLRGLGVDNTLVLVNGRRVAASGASSSSPFVDLNSIPLAAVERIEVLTDGASAIYGSDAVTGVVNIILKKDFTGSEVNLGLGASQEGGAGERQASFVTGWLKDRFRVLLNGEYFRRGSLDAVDRSFSTTDDMRARGGADRRTSSATNPGNVFSMNGQPLPGLSTSSAGIPAGQNGRNLTPADFTATAGQINLQSLIAETFHLIPASERFGFGTRLSSALTSQLSAFAEASYSHNETIAHRSSPTLSGLVVPAANPFNPFGQPVRVNWLASELGPVTRTSKTDTQRIVVGLEGGLVGSWRGEASFGYSRDEWDDAQAPFLRNASASGPVLVELLGRTDPATALNVFGDGEGTNRPEVLAELGFGRTASSGTGEVLVAAGKADGTIAKIAGRELRGAGGWEYREESSDFLSFVFDTEPSVPSAINRFNEDREVAAGFLELGLPLFSPEHGIPGLHALDLQMAVRFEHYSDFGDTTDPKVALRWQPLESLSVRGSVGTSFRAPSLRELFLTPGSIRFTVTDPRRNRESVAVDGFSGGNTALQPEESRSWNLGLVWNLPFLRGLSLTTDFWDLYQKEQITALTADELVAAEAFFPSRITRAQPTPQDVAAGLPGRLLAVDRTSLNASEARLRGVDFGIRYLNDGPIGQFDLRLNGAYIDSATRQLTPVSQVVQLAGTLSGSLLGEGTDRPVTRFRGNLSLFWSHDAWEVGVTERYTGSTRDPFSTLHPKVADQYETDLQINYKSLRSTGWLAGTQLSLGAENLFNKEPPFRDATLGFATALYSPRQAFYYLRLVQAF